MGCCSCWPWCKPQLTEAVYEKSQTIRPKPKIESNASSPSPSTDSRTSRASHVRFASTEQVSLATALKTTRPVTVIIEDENGSEKSLDAPKD